MQKNKDKKMTALTIVNEVDFLPMAGANPNKKAIARVTKGLPDLIKQAQQFGRSNSQTSLSLMSLTMMNGHSPMRILRQVLAEVDAKKRALSEAQISYATLEESIQKLEDKESPTKVEICELRALYVNKQDLERNINGSFKDLAVLMDNYDRVKKLHGIEEWDEHTFELEEKRHHVRRAFELLYRTMIQQKTSTEGPTEYLMQYGVHPQTAMAECSGYIIHSQERINNGELLTGKDCEEFLDAMSHKYAHCADEVSKRIFGEEDIISPDYMVPLEEIK